MLRASQKIGDVQLKAIMIGDEAAPLRSQLEVKYPLIEGQVKNWDDMELLWDYCFHEKLKLNKEDKTDKRILLTEPAKNPTKNREKMGEIMFEKYNFGAVMFEFQALLTLMSEGNRTGIVLDSGDGISHCIPVYEGMIQMDSIKHLKVAGSHVTAYLIKLLMARGYAFNSSADFELVREIKEDVCYMSIDPKKEQLIAKETTVLDKEYTLPDGRIIIVGAERFKAPEVLMKPDLVEIYDDDIGLMVYKSITSCALDIQKSLAANIWLSGGTTMIPGLSSRIEHEITEHYVKYKFKGDRGGLNRVKI